MNKNSLHSSMATWLASPVTCKHQ